MVMVMVVVMVCACEDDCVCFRWCVWLWHCPHIDVLATGSCVRLSSK